MSDLGFIPNGLLHDTAAGSQGEAFETRHMLVLIATDDAFLPISNILGLQTHASDVRGQNTLSYARSPIRASTFDGKTLYIKRKARVIERCKVRSYRAHFYLLTCW